MKRYLRNSVLCARAKPQDVLKFTCNICGRVSSYPEKKISREGPSCYYCGSTVRLRSVVHALSMELFGESLEITQFPRTPGLRGIGLSDWENLATPLAAALDYTNTFYHQAPLLDISSEDAPNFGKFDFILNSDVFEHVSQPIMQSFSNARALLTDNGVMIFTVPYVPGQTQEHFPELHKYAVTKQQGSYVLANTTADGREQKYSNLIFHGGPGTVLEMRLFGTDSLRNNFLEAGFDEPRIYSEDYPRFGIVWNLYRAEDGPYRPLIYGLDTPPWAIRPAHRY